MLTGLKQKVQREQYFWAQPLFIEEVLLCLMKEHQPLTFAPAISIKERDKGSFLDTRQVFLQRFGHFFVDINMLSSSNLLGYFPVLYILPFITAKSAHHTWISISVAYVWVHRVAYSKMKPAGGGWVLCKSNCQVKCQHSMNIPILCVELPIIFAHIVRFQKRTKSNFPALAGIFWIPFHCSL